jgi:hypothetical protein
MTAQRVKTAFQSTILSAMSTRGLIATMTIEEPTDADIFLAYVQQVLCPALRSGDVVVMDNLSSHKARGVRTWIENQGAELIYLPSHSPDLNPSKRPGPNSNNCFAPPRHAPAKSSIKPLQIYSRKSPLKMLRLGSGSALAHYSNYDISFRTTE